MPGQHKHRPVSFRPPEGDRAVLMHLHKTTGKPVNRILAEALRLYLDHVEGTDAEGTRPA